MAKKDKDKRWTAEHFSQANPAGKGRESVPALLRRVADSIEGHEPVTVQDIAFHMEMGDDGRDWPTMTVYFHRD